MKRLPFFVVIIFAFLLSAQSQVDTLKNTVLSSAQLKEDFNLYRRVLEETHPGLYRYTPKGQMQIKLDSIYGLLEKPLPFYDFFKMMAGFNADIKCAHSSVLPTKNTAYMNTVMKVFPFFIYPVDNKFYIIFNGTPGNQTIELGHELTHINQRPMDSIAKELRRHFWADGFIELSKNQVLQGQLFSLFYYFIIERPDTFQVTLKNLKGEVVSVTVEPQTLAAIQGNYGKNPINKKALKLYNQKNKDPWQLEFLKEPSEVAMLHFTAFGGKGMNTENEARQEIRRFMDKALRKIEKRKSKYLIVDVRGNGGGWDVQGLELLSYLIKSDDPFKYYDRLHTISDDSEFLRYSDLSKEEIENVKNELIAEPDGTFTLDEEENPNLKLHYPKPNKFKGKVYVLMNERSASTTSEFLAVAKSNNIGIFVGEESGGAYEGGNGGSFINMPLPSSHISINIPLVYYKSEVNPVEISGRGTMPDYRVEFKSEDLLTRYDRQLEFAKSLIKREGKLVRN